MSKRLLSGKHPTIDKYGVWLSRPGVDVYTATDPQDFLLSSDSRNEQIVLSGEVAIGAYPANVTPVTVFLPYALSVAPAVSFIESVSGDETYYPFRKDLVISGTYGLSCITRTDRIIFINAAPYDLQIRFLVFRRAVTG